MFSFGHSGKFQDYVSALNGMERGLKLRLPF